MRHTLDSAADVVRPELRLDLQAGLHRAFEQKKASLTLPLPVQFNGGYRQVSLHIRPLSRDDVASAALVVFLEGGPIMPGGEKEAGTRDVASSQLVAQLRNELLTTRAHLRTTREQYETVTEALRASNEELQSINEELQTLNNELKLKLDDVSRAHNDLQNLMSATDVATLFLSTTLRIKRFTPRLADLFNVVQGDEDRPISDLTHRLEYGDLIEDANRVLADFTPLERTIRTVDGRWLLMRLRPYRTLEHLRRCD